MKHNARQKKTRNKPDPGAIARPDFERIFSVREVRAILGIGYVAALRLISSGAIPAFRVGEKIWRVRESDLNDYIKGGKP